MVNKSDEWIFRWIAYLSFAILIVAIVMLYWMSQQPPYIIEKTVQPVIQENYVINNITQRDEYIVKGEKNMVCLNEAGSNKSICYR